MKKQLFYRSLMLVSFIILNLSLDGQVRTKIYFNGIPNTKIINKEESISMELYEFKSGANKKKWSFKGGQNHFSLNVSGLIKGIYVLKVTKGKAQQSTKIIID